MKILTMTQQDRLAWDDYALHHADSSFFHRVFWQDILEKGAGLKTVYLMAMQDGSVAGILPLTFHKSTAFGWMVKRAVKSVAFGVEGGPLVSSPEAFTALNNRAWQLAEDFGATYLEYRSVKATNVHSQAEVSGHWQHKDTLYARFRRPILDGEEANILALPNKQRPTVRKGIKAGLVCNFDGQLDDFYAHYSASVHRLGTPIFSKKYFKALTNFVPEELITTLTVHAPDQPSIDTRPLGESLGALMTFYHKGVGLPYYMGSPDKARVYAMNDFMLFQQLVYAGQHRDCHTYDLGRSKVDTGAFAFKKKLGYEPEFYQYSYRLPAGKEMPDVSPKNPKYQLFIKLWQRLPLFMANRLGPLVSHHLS